MPLRAGFFGHGPDAMSCRYDSPIAVGPSDVGAPERRAGKRMSGRFDACRWQVPIRLIYQRYRHVPSCCPLGRPL